MLSCTSAPLTPRGYAYPLSPCIRFAAGEGEYNRSHVPHLKAPLAYKQRQKLW